MTLGRLVWQSLRFHWRGNSAVLLGVAVATAVLTGALLVGDSLRGSLRDQVEEQLGWIDHALVSGRFIRAELAEEVSAERAAPAILLQGTAIRHDERGDVLRRAGRVTILGLDARFWETPPVTNNFWMSDRAEVVLNQALAHELGSKIGDFISINMQKTSNVPRDSLLAHRDAAEVLGALRLQVSDILPDSGPGRFQLTPSMDAPLNAFVPLATLQNALFPPKRPRDRGSPNDQTGPLINALFARGDMKNLNDALHQKLRLEDFGLLLKAPQDPEGDSRGYLSLESRQMFLEPHIETAAATAALTLGLRTAPTLVYLANRISDGTNEIPYSVVAAMDPAMRPPLALDPPPGIAPLEKDDIVLVDWEYSPLQLTPGVTVTMTYFEPEQEQQLKERSASFRFRGFVPLTDHRDLAPEFPGLTDRLTLKDWKPPFEIDQRRIKDRDEEYWAKYRTTPKAYVTLAKGQELWGSRFGRLTSLRLAEADENGRAEGLAELQARYSRALVAELHPKDAGLAFDDVRKRALGSTTGSADFSMYFLSFSFFLIVASVLLIGLLLRLNLDRRAPELGILLATGYRQRQVRSVVLAEFIILAAAGALIGMLGALAYSWFLLELLRAWWPGNLDRSFLRLHARGMSFLIGYAAAVIVTSATILWTIRAFRRVSITALLGGRTSNTSNAGPGRTPGSSRWIMYIALLGTVSLIVWSRFVHDHMAEALTFFGSGALLLVASLAATWAWMHRMKTQKLVGHGTTALARLGVRNAARHPTRSLLTSGLVAFAIFVVIAVATFHRDADSITMSAHSGTGGFALIADSTLPLYQDLNTEDGQDALNMPDPPNPALRDARVLNFRLRGGDDASCLNLYQPNRPQVLGVPDAFVQLNRFRFRSPQTENAWELLKSDASDGIPTIVDGTTAQYILKKGIGDHVEIPNERGVLVQLRIVGLLADSILQSQLMISDTNFLHLFPNHEGYQFFLIDAPSERAEVVKTFLESSLAERGFSATPTARRLEAFWAVENTYLATFQALGALGLFLGALGLSVVLLRTAWERRGELALFRALGYRRSALSSLLLFENGFLLVLGLVMGTLAALVSVAPHLRRAPVDLPLLRMCMFIVCVLVFGLTAAAIATYACLRANLIPALRQE